MAVFCGLLSVHLIGSYIERDEWQKTIFYDVSLPLVNLLATGALFFAARRTAAYSRRQAVGWLCLALAQLSYTAADVAWLVLEVFLQMEPFPSLADGFYLAYYPLALIGVLLLILRRASRIELIHSLLNIGTILLAATLGLWNFLLGPIAAANEGETWVVKAFSMAYPLGDLALIWGLLILLYLRSKRRSQSAIALLIAGMVVTIAVDLAFSALTLAGSYQTSNLVDLGYMISYALFGLAGMAQAGQTLPEAPVSSESALEFPGPQRKIAFLFYVPYVWLAVAFGILIAGRYLDLPMDFPKIAIGVGGMIFLSILRQVSALYENNRLYRQLHTAAELVRQQADELRQTNQALREQMAERQRAESRLAYDALHDALTGLPNRALLMDRLGHAIDTRKRYADFGFSLLFLDLDHFKKVNDTLGHSFGDQLLATVARRLESCAGEGASVARLSGDEFVLLIEEALAEEQLQRLAGRIQQALQAPAKLDGRTFFPSASLGIVADTREYKRPEEILRDAELAMYRAKERGKACVEFFHPEMHWQALTRLELETDLRAALEREEFLLYYQPIVFLRSGRLAGFEALLRWKHPQRGFISPGEFIPIAEESGLILPLGEWALLTACRQMRAWQERFPHRPEFKLNVNISGKQFALADFTERVARALRQSGLAGSCLRLEITESVYLSAHEVADAVFAQLGKLGVQLQIDDFGTGYSSLGYLQRFPVQAVKIDRSFTQRLDSRQNSSEIVSTIIRLARQLNMETTAEGIETTEQREALQALGCDYGQGYLFSPPLKVEEVEQLLAELSRGVGEAEIWSARETHSLARLTQRA